MYLLVIIGIFLFVFGVIIALISKPTDNDINKIESANEIIYYKKDNYMTYNELKFYSILRELESEYKIVPQVNLATVIEKRKKGYTSELYRNIDFGIFSNDYSEILLLIELNDSSHNQYDRIKRDKKVKYICDQAGIKLITFYTNKPNEKEYVIDRIKKNISN